MHSASGCPFRSLALSVWPEAQSILRPVSIVSLMHPFSALLITLCQHCKTHQVCNESIHSDVLSSGMMLVTTPARYLPAHRPVIPSSEAGCISHLQFCPAHPVKISWVRRQSQLHTCPPATPRSPGQSPEDLRCRDQGGEAWSRWAPQAARTAFRYILEAVLCCNQCHGKHSCE